jgi:hypothetical protein
VGGGAGLVVGLDFDDAVAASANEFLDTPTRLGFNTVPGNDRPR